MRTLSILSLILVLSAAVFSQTSLKIGSQAPLFNSTALDGTEYDLNELHGKVVVLTFWSTKCQICRGEIPKLNQFVDRFDTNKVIFLALTMDHEDKIEAYLKSNPIRFHVLPNSFGVVLQYADRDKQGNLDMGFPSYFVIDQTGRLEYRASGWDRTEKLDSEINRLLATQ